MKTYEKPKMMVLSFTANDALCSCAAKTRFDKNLSNVLEIAYSSYGVTVDGFFTPAEGASAQLFDSANSCNNVYEPYCKNTPAGYNLFTS